MFATATPLDIALINRGIHLTSFIITLRVAKDRGLIGKKTNLYVVSKKERVSNSMQINVNDPMRFQR